MTGKLSKNPYDFNAFNVNKLSVSINNVTLEYNSLNLKYNDTYLLAYQNLINGLKIKKKTIGINRTNYVDGNVFYCFQIQNFESESNFYPAQGSLKLDVGFSSPLPDNITMIVLSQTQNVLTIDKYLNCEVENQGVLQ